MEFSKTDDVALELSTIIQDISATDCENELTLAMEPLISQTPQVKIPHTESKSPASYNQIMQTAFPPKSPKFVEQKTSNKIDPDIIDTVAGINIYNRQVLNMNEVDKITCYYPDLDHLHPTVPDKEKPSIYRRILGAIKSDPDNTVDNQAKDDDVMSNEKKHHSDTSATTFENGEPYGMNTSKPYSDDMKESEKPENGMTENPDVKSEDSKVRDEIPKTTQLSPCCFGLRSETKDALNDDTEYEPKKEENDPESDPPRGDMEYEKLHISSDEEKELPSDDIEYRKSNIENDEEKLLPSEDTESDMSSLGNNEERGLLNEDMEYAKLNMDKEVALNEKSLTSVTSVKEKIEPNVNQEELESSKSSAINLAEEKELSSNSNSQSEADDKKENSDFSYQNLNENDESNLPSGFQATPLDSVENQDDLLSSNYSKTKKKRSILKRLFSKKRN